MTAKGDELPELGDDAKNLIAHFRKAAREEYESVLDERLEILGKPDAGDAGGGDGKAPEGPDEGEKAPAPPPSLAAKLGF